jgi:outer membrane receptor protein involved in Fe transport
MKTTGISLAQFGRVLGVAITGMSLTMPAAAQDDEVYLDEIVVISKSRGAVNVMDVPTAITAVTGAQIEASGIKDMFDLQENVPGLIVGRSQTATTSNFAIRGVGSTSNNFGVESSVGLYVDGVYRSRQSSIINELVDVEAVEVLRGPQGTLFGKNTASGAINIRTVAPNTDSADGFIDITAGDFDLQRISGAVNIPLTDRVAFRGTVFASQRDGFVQDDNFGNYITDQSGPVEDVYNDRDRLGFRAQIGYDNGEDFDMRVILDYAEIDEICCVGTTRVDSVFSRAGLAAGQAINGPDALLLQMGRTVYTDQNYSGLLPPLPNLISAEWDEYRTAVNHLPVSTNEDRGISVEFNKDIGDMKLTSVTAYRAFDTFDFIDADFTDTAIAERTNIAEQTSISQELRLSGEFGESSTWVVGGYYFSQDIKSNTVTVGGSDLQTYSDLGLLASGSPLSMTDITNAVTGISLATGGLIPPGAGGFPAGAFANDDVQQEHDSFALFSQVDWVLSDAVTLTLGARYTDETKDINSIYTQTNPGTAIPNLTDIGTTLVLFQLYAAGLIPAPPDLTPLLAVAQPNEGWAAWTIAAFSPRSNVLETLKDDQVTGTAKLSWYLNDNMMAYASYATGFKAGGTNADRIFPLFSQLFDAEKSKSAEIGIKGDLGDRFRMALAFYQTDFEDFQANSFTGTGFNLQNAGDMQIQGLEFEWTWALFDNTNISGFYAYNAGEYETFIQGTCWDAAPFHTLMPDSGEFDPVTETCNRSGEDIPYNPEERINIGITQTFPMGNNDMFIRAEYSHQSDFTTDGDNDPLTRQDSFGILNVRLGMNIDSWNSTITLWGRNVTDERYYTGSFDPPLLDTGRTNSYPSEPATYGITFRKNWD